MEGVNNILFNQRQDQKKGHFDYRPLNPDRRDEEQRVLRKNVAGVSEELLSGKRREASSLPPLISPHLKSLFIGTLKTTQTNIDYGQTLNFKIPKLKPKKANNNTLLTNQEAQLLNKIEVEGPAVSSSPSENEEKSVIIETAATDLETRPDVAVERTVIEAANDHVSSRQQQRRSRVNSELARLFEDIPDHMKTFDAGGRQRSRSITSQHRIVNDQPEGEEATANVIYKCLYCGFTDHQVCENYFIFV